MWGATPQFWTLEVAMERFQSTLPIRERRIRTSSLCPTLLFQSTLPVWGATRYQHCTHRCDTRFQSTLPVWGATAVPAAADRKAAISIHAPRVGSDWMGAALTMTEKPFQSTLPVWGATDSITKTLEVKTISIHAPRVGSDFAFGCRNPDVLYFNPRSPCGERPVSLL